MMKQLKVMEQTAIYLDACAVSLLHYFEAAFCANWPFMSIELEDLEGAASWFIRSTRDLTISQLSRGIDPIDLPEILAIEYISSKM